MRLRSAASGCSNSAQPLGADQVLWQLLDENLVEGFVTCGTADVLRTVAAKNDPLLYEIVKLATLDTDDPFHSRLISETASKCL